MNKYVLTLEQAGERMASISSDFEQFGLDFEFVMSIDWKKITQQEIVANAHPKYIAKLKNTGVHRFKDI